MKIRFAFLSFAFVVASLLLPTRARAQMSDTERKSAARAAYTEGVKLQDDGKYAEALVRFEAAQKFFDAPTHLLHIAECQALSGRLVEATETYELLARKPMPAGSPEAFVQAQQQGQAELPALRARVPTLRVTTRPDASQLPGLQVNVNGVNMPTELLGIARPLNPGVYRFTAHAQGWTTERAVDVPLAEKEQKSIELVLVQRAGGPVVVTPVPPPYTPGAGGAGAGNVGLQPDRSGAKPAAASDPPSSFGLLFGVRGGAFIPAGSVATNVNVDQFANAGGGFGIDAYARLARMLLLGGTFEYGALGTPNTVANAVGDFKTSASTNYVGLSIGIVPNVDRVSFIGDVGIGSRGFSYKASPLQSSSTGTEISTRGLEFAFGAGISIPAGPVRIVPKAGVTVGSFGSVERKDGNVTRSGDLLDAEKATHAFLFVGLGLYYSLPFGPKPGAAAPPPAP